jgi:hypothetical protein
MSRMHHLAIMAAMTALVPGHWEPDPGRQTNLDAEPKLRWVDDTTARDRLRAERAAKKAAAWAKRQPKDTP